MMRAPAARVRVRNLRYRDLPAVTRIERAAFGAPWRAREFAFEISKPSGICLAAVDDGGLSGYLVSCPQGPLWNVRNLAVSAPHRRRGIGSALLGALLETEAVAGRHLFLEVRETDRGAIALYERLGFRTVGRRPDFYWNDQADALLMCCSLPLRCSPPVAVGAGS
jgi:ribosomal-protein-alanine N-acetyltransferase